MNIERLREDHNKIMEHVTELRKITQSGIAQNADAILRQLRAMNSVIKLHLAAEDRVLYPGFAESQDPALARTGKQFQAEMGSIATAYMEFSGKWITETKIAGDPESFRLEANNIFKALHQRIQKENQELYPLADRI